MAENLGQIDVVIKNDSQSLPAPGQAPGGQGGGEPGGPGLPGVGVGGAFPGRPAAGLGAGAIAIGAGVLAIGALAGAAALAVKKLKSWTGELANTTKRLAYLNSYAALSGVIEEFGELRRNLSLGRVLGPTMLSVARLKDRIQDNIQPLKEIFALLKAKAVENFMALMVVITKRLGEFSEIITVVVKVLQEAFNQFMTFIAKLGTALFMHGQSLGFIGDMTGITGAGAALMGLVQFVEKILKEIKDAKEDERVRDEYEEAKLENAELMTQLQQLTGGFWRHDTQTIGALGTGQTLNPRGFEERERNRGS